MPVNTHVIQLPIEIPDVVAGNVPTPGSGYLIIFSEGGKLKQKDSAGTVTDLTLTGSGGSLTDGDYTDIVVSGGGTVLVVKEPTLRKSETSVNNSPLFTAINKFDTLETNDWANGTISLNTTDEAEGTGCMRLNLSTLGVTGVLNALPATTNFLRRAFKIKVRASDWAKVSTAEILFWNDAGFTNAYVFRLKGTNGKLVTPPNGEWIERVFNPGDFPNGDKSGTPNWQTMTHYIVRGQASSGTPTLDYDDFEYLPSTQKPFVACTFDDGLLTQFTNGKAKLDQYDIKGTFYVIHNELTPGTNMETTHHDILSSQGHDISGHGGTNLTTLTQAQRLTDLRAMKKYLTERGYRGSNNYALPNGAYNDAVLADVRDYFNSIANIDWLSNTPEYSPQYLINRFSPDASTSTATIQAWIDNAILYGGCVVIAWHGIVASGAIGAQVTQATYDTIMDYIGSKKNDGSIDTGTLTDYYARPLVNNPILLPSIDDPITPPAGWGNLYAKTIAGRVVPKFKGPSGLDYPIQSALWQNNQCIWTSTTATAGVWMGTAGAGAGTYTTALPTTTNKYTATKRGRWANVVTTTNQVLGQRNTEAMFFRGNAAGQGGFFFYTRCGFDVWTNGGRFFAGMHSGTTVISADPSALNNTVGFCVDAADNGAISFLTRGTAATKASTGLTITSNQGFDIFFFCAPNSSQIFWRIVNYVTGAEKSDIATANLPTNTTMLTAWVLASNAALTTVTAIQLGVNKIYVETDF